MLDATASWDRNPDDSMQWEWSITDATGEHTIVASEEVATHQISEPGVYTIELVVTDEGGSSSRDQRTVQIGNAPPQIRVDLDGNRSFFSKDSIGYSVSVEDLEDGSSATGAVSYTHLTLPTICSV